MKWHEHFRDLLGELPEGEDALRWVRAELRKRAHPVAERAATTMIERFIEGDFDEAATTEIDLVWDTLFVDGLARDEVIRAIRSGREEDWRRWAWTSRWHLCDQDEDIVFLFDQPKRLLTLAREPNCPKRDYLLGCAAHGVRDRVHASGLGPSAFDEARPLIFDAKSARAPELAAYFERLASYAKKGSVDREEAIQRAHDLHRCAPPRGEDVHVQVEGDFWRVHYATPGHSGTVFRIHRKTGAMTATKTAR